MPSARDETENPFAIALPHVDRSGTTLWTCCAPPLLQRKPVIIRNNERAWWQRYGIDPLKIASSLWIRTHSVEPTVTGPTESDSGGIGDGRDLAGIDAASRRNDETKPMVTSGLK
jgi:hypothetical protein